MKIRINGNTLRFRLSKSEVAQLATDGEVENEINFGTGILKYQLRRSSATKDPEATLNDHTIVVSVPEVFAREWPDNETIGLEHNQKISETETLYILIEKDFKCIDNTNEDQSDNYDNPKVC